MLRSGRESEKRIKKSGGVRSMCCGSKFGWETDTGEVRRVSWWMGDSG